MRTLLTGNRIACRTLVGLALVFSLSALAGCSGGSGSSLTAYEAGFEDGFALDDVYFTGYDDSWFTVGSFPILYQGNEIPYIDDFSYDAGYFDGQFYAYNDGYFIAYRYAFIIGFSEGYDNAFAPDYLDFLDFDIHSEYFNGGFTDGYNDGFTEGRVFGAYDYEAFLPFDWLDALRDWESGTDLYFAEVNVGTGPFSPAILYEWGTDPHLLRSDGARPRAAKGASMAMRGTTTADDHTAESRPLDADQIAQLEIAPADTPRTDRPLTLSDTWFTRISAYLNDSTARSVEAWSARREGPRQAGQAVTNQGQ